MDNQIALPDGWQVYQDNMGNTYYWNTVTQTAQWEFPGYQQTLPPQTQLTALTQPTPPQTQLLYVPACVTEISENFQYEGEYDFSKEEGVESCVIE